MTGVVSQGAGGRNDKRPRPALRLAQATFLAMIFSLGWMKDPVSIGGLGAFPSDFLFLVTAVLWLLALLRRETDLRWHRVYWLLGAYFLAMTLSVEASADPQRSVFKLATQAYLLALAILTFNLVRTLKDLERVARWWVAAAAAVACLGVGTLLLFPLLGRDSILSWPLHHFGTLPPGPYPRLELTFSFPAMLVNYLTVAMAMLLIGRRLGWFSKDFAWAVGAGVFLSALFALAPAFGGMLFFLGAWTWHSKRDESPGLARAALLVGGAMPVFGALLAAATPILHPTDPFLIRFAGITLAPSVRLLAWIEASQNFLTSPVFGRGIGIAPVSVVYEQANLCGGVCVTDAHNTFLSFAVQTGIIGLVPMLGLVLFVALKLRGTKTDAIVFGLAIAWLAGFALQGLVGSFEDARHLWIVLGLLLSASQFKPSAT